MAYCLFILALTRTATGIIIQFLVSNSFELEGGHMKASQSNETTLKVISIKKIALANTKNKHLGGSKKN